MQVSTSQQIYVFSLFVMLGISCGAFFDVQRFLRKISFAGQVRTTLEDTLFIVFFILATLMVSLRINNGEVRYYEVMGSVSGVLFYASVLSRPFLRVLEIVLKVVCNILIKPLRKLLDFILGPTGRFFRIVKRCTTRLRRRIRNLVKSVKKGKKLIKKRVKML